MARSLRSSHAPNADQAHLAYADAGDDISLYVGPMSIAEVEATGRIWLQTNGKVKFRCELGSHGSSTDLDDVDLDISGVRWHLGL